MRPQDNGRGRICFVNIADPEYNPKKNMGIDYDEAMETIHVIRQSGEVSGQLLRPEGVAVRTEVLRGFFDERCAGRHGLAKIHSVTAHENMRTCLWHVALTVQQHTLPPGRGSMPSLGQRAGTVL